MRYPENQKNVTRKRILDAAIRSISQNGITASNVVGIMHDVGLSPAGLYPHFSSKDALVNEAVKCCLVFSKDVMLQCVESARLSGTSPVDTIIDTYLSPAHVNSLDKRCALAVLGPELSRQSALIRRTAELGTDELIHVLSSHLIDKSETRARAILCLLVGAVQQAITTPSEKKSLKILAAGKEVASYLALQPLSRELEARVDK